jgi:hypothetical protein
MSLFGRAPIPDIPVDDTIIPVVHGEIVSGGEMRIKREGFDEIQSARAEAFVSLVQEGMKPGAAARQLSLPISELRRDPLVVAKMKELVEGFTLTANERASITRARLNKIVLGDDDKTALAAAKLIAEDPETGMSPHGPVSVNVGIFSADTRQVMDRLPDFNEDK